MAPAYYTYSTGTSSKHLHLGNLVHNYRDPGALEPYVSSLYTDPTEESPSWARVATLENYAMTLGKDTEGKQDGKSRYRVVAAERTTRMEIVNPKEFFAEKIVGSAEAKKWLRSRLSAAEALEAKEQPEIWLLIGLILMTHATWSLLSTTSAEKFTPGLQSPFDPHGVESLRRLSVSDGIKPTFGFRADKDEEKSKDIEGAKVVETGKFPGTRGWAARWQRVIIKDGKPQVAEEYAENREGDDVGEKFEDEQFWDALVEKAEELSK